MLSRIAEADGFRPALGLDRRAALWAVKGLPPTDLPLFAAAARAGDGTLSVTPATEYDGDAAEIVSEIDPFAP